MPECRLSSTEVSVVQTSDMGKENRKFSLLHARVPPILDESQSSIYL